MKLRVKQVTTSARSPFVSQSEKHNRTEAVNEKVYEARIEIYIYIYVCVCVYIYIATNIKEWPHGNDTSQASDKAMAIIAVV